MTHLRGKAPFWPWHLFAALGLTFIACLGAHHFIKPALSLSFPTLLFQGKEYQVKFQVSNNTAYTQSARLAVIFGSNSPTESGVSYQELARTELAIQLAPKESREVGCMFATKVRFFEMPTVRAEVISVSDAHPNAPNNALQRTATGGGLPVDLYVSTAGSRR